ncbi:hypothetical protein V1514DRAFT_323854 [Lipomyces japonicus]|uniref:uncharacterized protein n=1 Tax=Lipomyces japonicus TaxID=56871 RepID=UPI0034CEEFE5
MEFSLRCNGGSCRRQLANDAVVTTCSHIFCVDCANRGFGMDKTCPACQTTLTEPDDVVLTSLKPKEDYKTSVLAGLNPATISDIASRALEFWSYQCAQEIIYQEFNSKKLNDKCSKMNQHLEKMARDADSQIEALRARITTMKQEHDGLVKKNFELTENVKDKNRQYSKLQGLYDQLRRKSLVDNFKNQEEFAIDSSVHNETGLINMTMTSHRKTPSIGTNGFGTDYNATPNRRRLYMHSDGEVTPLRSPRRQPLVDRNLNNQIHVSAPGARISNLSENNNFTYSRQ